MHLGNKVPQLIPGTNLQGCSDCGNTVIEAFGRCASCNAIRRKEERMASKEKVKKKVPQMSNKRAGEVRKYGPMRKEFLRKNRACQAHLEHCWHRSSQIHHTTTSALDFLNTETWMAVCGHCHTMIETVMSAAERREKGFLK